MRRSSGPAWARAAESILAAKIGTTPSLEVPGDFCRSARRCPTVKGSLRALAEGGWWSRQRLFEAGLVDSYACAACGGATCSLRRWSCHCPHSLELVQAADEDVQAAVTSAALSSVPDHLFDHGFPARVPLTMPPLALVRAVDAAGNTVSLEGVHLAGEAFSDGSLVSSMPRGVRRGGWTFIGMSEDRAV